MKVKVILADDHVMIREGIKQLLEFDQKIEVVAQANDGVECLEQLSKDSHEYYMQFKETRDAYYKELEDLRKMIVNEENSVVRMRYCDLYEQAQRALDKNLKNLGEHMNQTIKGSKKKRGFLEKITSHFMPSFSVIYLNLSLIRGVGTLLKSNL